jgi:hypothetical protein
LSIGSASFSAGENTLYEPRLAFDHVIPADCARSRDRYEAVTRSIRDALSEVCHPYFAGFAFLDETHPRDPRFVAGPASGRFSSDRSIAEYVREIWHADACPVD